MRMRGGGVDGHGHRDLFEGDRLRRGVSHVVEGVDGDSELADFAAASGVIESRPISVGRSKAVPRPVWPLARRKWKRSLVCRGVPKPANCRMVQRRPRYMLGWMPRVKGKAPGVPIASAKGMASVSAGVREAGCGRGGKCWAGLPVVEGRGCHGDLRRFGARWLVRSIEVGHRRRSVTGILRGEEVGG